MGGWKGRSVAMDGPTAQPLLFMARGVGAFTRDQCPIARSVGILGGGATLTVVRALAFAPSLTFTGLLAESGLPRATLSQKLKGMVEDGLVATEPYQQEGHRQRLAYRLTEAGRALRPMLLSLIVWAHRHAKIPGWRFRVLETDIIGDAFVTKRKWSGGSTYGGPLVVVRMPVALIGLIEKDKIFKPDSPPHEAYAPWVNPTYHYSDNSKYVNPYINISEVHPDQLGPNVNAFHRPNASINREVIECFK
jgi:DNA-binding HxlR family transcriptional regulator